MTGPVLAGPAGAAPSVGQERGVRTVAVLAPDDVISFDLATPVEVVGRATGADGGPAYEVVVCGPAGRVQAGPLGIDVPAGLEVLEVADTVVVPGRYDPLAATAAPVLAALRAAAGRGARLASICVGAFTLAEAGLLDGRTATTPLGRRGRARPPAPGGHRRRRRPVRRPRSTADLGRGRRRSRPVPAHGPRGPGGGCRSRRGPGDGDAAGAQRGAGAVHQPPGAHAGRRFAGAAAGVAARPPRRAGAHLRAGPAGGPERALAAPPVPGTDRGHPDPLAAGRAGPPGPAAARDRRPRCRADRRAGRAGQPVGVPRGLPRRRCLALVLDGMRPGPDRELPGRGATDAQFDEVFSNRGRPVERAGGQPTS